MPFVSSVPDSLTVEVAPDAAIEVHGYWQGLAEAFWDGSLSWWDPSTVGGLPAFRGGLPFSQLTYFVTPSWFAPGLAAAVITVVAILGMGAFLRGEAMSESAALLGGLAFGFGGPLVTSLGLEDGPALALVPWLFWASARLRDRNDSRSVIAVAVVVALMLTTSALALAAWALFAVFVHHGLVHYLVVSQPGRLLALGRLVLGAGFGAALASPVLLNAYEEWQWADHSHLVGRGDTSAEAATLLTLLSPTAWGNDSVGIPWFGEGSFATSSVHVGAVVTTLAIAALIVVGWRDRFVPPLAAVGLIGVAVAYIGGPFTTVSAVLTRAGTPMTTARFLVSFAVAGLAARGLDAVMERQVAVITPRGRLLGIGLVAIAVAPLVWSLAGATWANGAARSLLAYSTVPVLALTASVAVVVAVRRRLLAARPAALVVVAVVAVEALFFAMPIPTTTSRSERLRPTAAHQALEAVVDDGARIAAEGLSFPPGTSGGLIHDIRGSGPRSVAATALIDAADPRARSGAAGGSAVNPVFGPEVANTGLLASYGVGVWAQPLDSAPPGPRIEPAEPAIRVDPAVQGQTGELIVPAHGLRAVLLSFQTTAAVELVVTVATDNWAAEHRSVRGPAVEMVIAAAIEGDGSKSPAPGALALVSVRVIAEPGTALVGATTEGRVQVGSIGGVAGSTVTVDDATIWTIGSHRLVRIPEQVQAAAPEDVAAIVAKRPPEASVAAVTVPDGDTVGGTVDETAVGDLRGGGTVLATHGTAGRIEVTTTHNGPHLIVAAVHDYPGWSATIDGQFAPLVTVDAAFVGVVVPAGEHRVEFRFLPTRLRLSFLLVLLAIISLIALRWRSGPDPAGSRVNGRRVNGSVECHG